MIRIAGSEFNPSEITHRYQPDSIQTIVVNQLFSSSQVYEYNSLAELDFELNMRNSIVDSAIKLHGSGLHFRTFSRSMCNEDYWNRTSDGGFMLKYGVNPADAIRDIYINGSKYGTECSTAIVIVFYGAALDMFPNRLFDRIFSGIRLMNWQYVDSDLGIENYINPADYLPGDCRYFKNPEVDPLTPQWQGENAIDLGNGMYYGHGIGIMTADGIINALNNHRVDGAVQSAYLMDSAVRPDFKYLAGIQFSEYLLSSA